MILEALMSAFLSSNPESARLYMLPLSSDASSKSTDSLSTIVINSQTNKDKGMNTSSSRHAIYSCSGDEYRQCRRIRNTAIATQQKQSAEQCSSEQNSLSATSQTFNERPQPRLSRFWRTVRSFQIGPSSSESNRSLHATNQ